MRSPLLISGLLLAFLCVSALALVFETSSRFDDASEADYPDICASRCQDDDAQVGYDSQHVWCDCPDGRRYDLR